MLYLMLAYEVNALASTCHLIDSIISAKLHVRVNGQILKIKLVGIFWLWYLGDVAYPFLS